MAGGEEISADRLRRAVDENREIIRTLLDYEQGRFFLSFREYELLPKNFFSYLDLIAEFRGELRKEEEEKRKRTRRIVNAY